MSNIQLLDNADKVDDSIVGGFSDHDDRRTAILGEYGEDSSVTPLFKTGRGDWLKAAYLGNFKREEEVRPMTQAMRDLAGAHEDIARNYARSSGTETGTIAEHTADVAHHWNNQLTDDELGAISQHWGSNVRRLMDYGIALHDIGKPDAIAAGNKSEQHEHTKPLLEKGLRSQGFSDKDIKLAHEIFGHDLIGKMVRRRSGEAVGLKPLETAKLLIDKANSVGMFPPDFAKLALAFYHADAGSYPQLRRGYMKDENGKFEVRDADAIRPIKNLAEGKDLGEEVPDRVRTPYRKPVTALRSKYRGLPHARSQGLAEQDAMDELGIDGDDIDEAKKAWHWRSGMSTRSTRILHHLADTAGLKVPAIYRGMSFRDEGEYHQAAAPFKVGDIYVTGRHDERTGRRSLESFTTDADTGRKYAEQPSAAVLPHSGVAAGHGIVVELRPNEKGIVRGVGMHGENEVLPPVGRPHRITEVRHELRNGFNQLHVVAVPLTYQEIEEARHG